MPRPASTRRRRCRRRSRSRPSHRWPRSRQLRGPCRQQPGREVQQGGLSRPAAALAEPVPRPASTRRRRCRRRSRSRPSHRWPRSRQLRGPCRQQPGRGVQRGGLSRPAQAEPVTPPARTSLRRCRRCGESCLSRRTPRQLAPAALLAVRAAPAVASSIPRLQMPSAKRVTAAMVPPPLFSGPPRVYPRRVDRVNLYPIVNNKDNFTQRRAL